MRIRTATLACAIATSFALLSGVGVNGQSRQDAIPRTRDGKPDLSGIWQANNTANWDLQDHEASAGPSQFGSLLSTPPGLGVVDGNEIPYQAWALEQKKKNYASRYTEDPEAKCYLPGIPRATYMPFPFQIVQSDQKILMLYEYASAVRSIHMDKVPDPPVDTWMGHSLGRWERDTLVVKVSSFFGQTWFDRAGNFHSDGLTVTERYTPAGANLINYEATMEDPKVFTRPWTIRMPLYRRMEKDATLLEFKCVEFSEELLYGHLRKKPTR